MQFFFEILKLKTSMLTLRQKALLRQNNLPPFSDYTPQATAAPYLSRKDEIENAFEIFEELPYDFISEYNGMIVALCSCARMTLVAKNNFDRYSIEYQSYEGQNPVIRTHNNAELLKFVVENIGDQNVQLAVSDTIAKREVIAMQIAEFNYKYTDVLKFVIGNRARFPEIIFKLNKAMRHGWAKQALKSDKRLMADMEFLHYKIEILDTESQSSYQNQRKTAVYYTDDTLLEVYQQNYSLLLEEIETIRTSIIQSRATAETLSMCIERIVNPTPELVQVINLIHNVIRNAWCQENIPGDNRLISNLQAPEYLVAKLKNNTPADHRCHYTSNEWDEMPQRRDFVYYTQQELKNVYCDNCLLIKDYLHIIVPYL
jgi:hypothetical protein